jgi:hypothetical protein
VAPGLNFRGTPGPPGRTGTIRRQLTSNPISNPEALLRLAGAVLIEADDEWQVSDRRYLSEGSMDLLNRNDDPAEEVAQSALIASKSPHR